MEVATGSTSLRYLLFQMRTDCVYWHGDVIEVFPFFTLNFLPALIGWQEEAS
jgi:hypothetical protein